MTPRRVTLLVVGTPRSGTTLVQRIACELPGVAIPYETHFFTKGLALLAARGTFPLQGAELRGGLDAYVALAHLEGSGLSSSAVLDRLGSAPATPLDVFDAVVAELAGPADVLGEKTPGHLHWVERLAAARPELRVVAVVREPRAVVASHRNVPWGGVHADVIARRWLDDQRVLASLLSRLRERILLLRYEDVVAAPERARTAIADLLGLADAGGDGPGGNGLLHLPWETWKHDAGGEIETDRVEAWPAVLTRAEADRVGAICGPELERFGYGSSRPPRLRAAWAMASAPRGAGARRRALEARRAAMRAAIAAADLGGAPAAR